MPTILVTGATDGIGRETALELGRRGARVLVHGRSEAKARTTAEELARQLREAPRGARAGLRQGEDRDAAPGERTAAFAPVWGDLASLAQVRALAEQVRALGPLDGALHNAGVFLHERRLTEDGFEATFAINHLAPFALTHLLLPALRAAPRARVAFVSSIAHGRGRVHLEDQSTRGFEGYAAYAASKLMNVLSAYALARRLPELDVNALHPGVINTKLLREGFGARGAGVAQGARTSVRVMLASELAGSTGRYFSDEREVPSSAASHDKALQDALYAESCRLARLEPLPG